MSFTNSPLVSYTKLSPNHSGQRNHTIDTITIHCVCGQCSVETIGAIFAPVSRQASSNYGVGVDGRIGMYCEEKNRSWCTSSPSNDHRAITIEVASDTTHPYAVNDKAYAAMLDLVTDICKRNGIKKLVWSTNKDDRVNHRNGCNMTVHRDYANKSCPGEYLYSRHGAIAEEVNKRLGATSSETKSVEAGDVVKITPGATYYTGKAIPSWVIAKQWIVRDCKGDRAVIDKSTDGANAICSPVNTKYLTVVSKKSTSEIKLDYEQSFDATKSRTYTVHSSDGLNLRSGASTSKPILENMPNGSKVRCYGYYTKEWLYVVSASGKTGFCHSAYLK